MRLQRRLYSVQNLLSSFSFSHNQNTIEKEDDSLALSEFDVVAKQIVLLNTD